jgi:ankyrin repeat protein
MLGALACSAPAFCGEIHDAAFKGDLQKIRKMLKDHPDLVSSEDNDRQTPLHMAAMFGHKDVAELLLANKADVNAITKIYRMTPLHMAAAGGYKNIVELLLANKANVDVEDKDGITPLS